jgi:hypothetical protein
VNEEAAMADPNDIKKQTHLNSEDVTPEQAAAEMSKGEKWAPHVSDGLDALENAISRKELKKWSKVVAEAWADDTFKERLIKDPPAALKEFGIEVPPGVEFRVVENTDKVRYVTLPPKPVGDASDLYGGGLGAGAAAFTSSTTFFTRPPTWADTWIIITA